MELKNLIIAEGGLITYLSGSIMPWLRESKPVMPMMRHCPIQGPLGTSLVYHNSLWQWNPSQYKDLDSYF